MKRSLVAVVSWYNFELIWLHRFLVIKTIKRTIKLTPTGKVRKQGSQAVVTLHNILINNKVILHYLCVLLPLLQKTNDITEYQRVFERKNDNTFPFICLLIVNVEGNELITHTAKFTKWEISSRARHVIKNFNCKTRRR